MSDPSSEKKSPSQDSPPGSSPVEAELFPELAVLLVDKQDLMSEALASHLERELGVGHVTVISSLNETGTVTEHPDIVIVDPLSLAGEHEPAEVLTGLRASFPGSNILVLTESQASTDVQACLASGAVGYLLKRCPTADFVKAVSVVARGQEYLQPWLGALLLRVELARSEASVPSLTPMESRVLRLLAFGHTNAEVAEILRLGLRTVEGSRSRLMSKLGVTTRAELVKAAVRLGMLDLDHPDVGGGSGAPKPASQAPIAW